MRAAVFKQAGSPWAIENRPIPVPSSGEVLLKVGRCGVCGTDLNMTSGAGYDFPCDSVLGHEFAGEVVELGAGVTRLRVGDVVTALPASGCGKCDLCCGGLEVLCSKVKSFASGFAQYALVAERSSVKLPQSLSLSDGALVEPLSVGLHGARLARMPQNARVLVLGAGAVGLAATFWARQLGAGRVVTASRSMRREDLAIAMGADRFVQTRNALRKLSVGYRTSSSRRLGPSDSSAKRSTLSDRWDMSSLSGSAWRLTPSSPGSRPTSKFT